MYRCCSFLGRVGNGIQMVYIHGTCLQDRSLNSTLQRLIGVGLSGGSKVTNEPPTSTSSPVASSRTSQTTVKSNRDVTHSPSGNNNTCSGLWTRLLSLQANKWAAKSFLGSSLTQWLCGWRFRNDRLANFMQPRWLWPTFPWWNHCQPESSLAFFQTRQSH